MRRTVLTVLAVTVTLAVTLILISGFPPEPVRQVTNPDANALDFSGRVGTFILVLIGLFVGVAVVGGGIAIGIWVLSREVKDAQAAKNEPTDPLNYRTYGHTMAVVLPVMLGFGVLGLLLTSQMLPVQASTEAVDTDHIFRIEFITISLIFGFVVGLMLHALFYFKADPDDWSDGRYIHGNLRLEFVWTIIPLLFSIAVGIYSIGKLENVTKEKPGEIGVNVVAFQWGWQFIYPTEMFFDEAGLADLDPRQLADIERIGGVFSSQLVLLQDQTVRLDMNSIDVIHSFWIPEMRVKQDVTPGVETHLRYTPTLPGIYRVRCAELCGLNHFQMEAEVVVYSKAEYEEWMDNLKASFGDPVEAGQSLYTQLCQTCHTTNGTSGTGPTWKDLVGYETEFESGSPVLADLAYVQESIWSPNTRIVEGFPANIMPRDFASRISELQTEQLFAYMCSLSDRETEVPDCARVNPPDEATEGEPTEDTSTTETGASDTESNTDDASIEDNSTDNADASGATE